MHAKDSVLARGIGTGLLLAFVLAGCASAPEAETPGTASRTLSQQEVDGLLLGRGMGMAAAAEINGYPGPQHVLDLKEELGLTPDQRFATSRLVGLVQGRARALGQRILDAERRLDADMAEGKLSSDQVRARLETIAALRAQLRFTHIDAHLEQKKILTPEQIRRYYELRGRKVTLAAPTMPPEPVEPLTLPGSPTPATAPETAPTEVTTPATISVPVAAPAALPDIAPEESAAPAAELPPQTETPPPATRAPAPEELASPAPVPVPAEAETPSTASPAMTPGMSDALPDAEPLDAVPAEAPPLQEGGVEPEPAREAPVEETQSGALPEASAPAEAEKPAEAPPLPLEPEIEDEPVSPPPPAEESSPRAPLMEDVPADEETATDDRPAMTPGMHDALPDAEPVEAPPLPEEPAPAEAERTPRAPSTSSVQQPPQMPQDTLSPGMQDALEFAEPASQTGARLSPGAQDAMEFAEPAPEAEQDVYIAPLEDEDELQELDAIDPEEPATIDLDK